MSQSISSSGFIINGIELRGFMRYDVPTPIPFRQKFTVITGPTGSGKTSILDSITYALYGKSSRTDEKMKIDEFVGEDGYVQLDFAQDGQDYRITRGRNNGRNYLTLSRGSQRIGGTTTELEQRIVNLVGLDYTGFVNSTFIRQDEMKHIGSETGAERLEIFERLFRLEIFERAQDLADKKLRDSENQSIDAQRELTEKQTEYEVTLPKEREKLNEATKNRTALGKEQEELEGKKKEQKALVDGLETAHKDYETAVRKISEISKDVEGLNDDFDDAREKNRKRAELMKEADKLKGSSKAEKKLLKEKTSLESRAQKAESFLGKIRIHRNALDRIKIQTEKNLSDARKEEKEQLARLKQFANTVGKEEAFDLLRLDGALKERIARIIKEVQWLKEFSPSLVESLRSEQEKTSDEASKVKSKVEKIGEGSFIKDEIESGLERISDRLEKMNELSKRQIQEEQSDLDKLEKQFKKVHFDKADSDRLVVVRVELKRIEKDVRTYDSYIKKLEAIPDQSTLLDSLKKRIEQFGEELHSHSDREKELSKDEKTYSSAKTELETLQDKASKLAQRLGKAVGEMGILDDRVKELEELRPMIEKLKEGLKEFGRQKEIFTILKQEIFHRKGILVFAINQLLQGISIEASLILGDLTDQRLNNIRITPSAETRGGTVLIEVEGVDGLFRDVSGFSGGEKTQINAALRFAIAKELSRMPQIGRSYGNMKTLFIDEGDLGSLDTESARIYFVRKLLNLGESFERIILITHITEVAEQFPNRIRIYMTPERNSRVEVGAIPA